MAPYTLTPPLPDFLHAVMSSCESPVPPFQKLDDNLLMKIE